MLPSQWRMKFIQVAIFYKIMEDLPSDVQTRLEELYASHEA